jgi:hypothetical protein
MDNKVFTRGKYKGLTYNYVRINHSSYFTWLLAQPVGNVYNFLDFIQYCMMYTKMDHRNHFV